MEIAVLHHSHLQAQRAYLRFSLLRLLSVVLFHTLLLVPAVNARGVSLRRIEDVCFDQGVEYAANSTLEEFDDVVSADACQHRCQQISECGAFSFDAHRTLCRLFPQQQPLFHAASTAGFVSGLRECDVDKVGRGRDSVLRDLAAECRLKNIALDGYDVGGGPMKFTTIGECQAACWTSGECFFYTFKKEDGTCLLKSNVARLNIASLEGFESGSKLCNWDSCYRSGFSMSGNDVKAVDDVEEVEDCRLECVKHPNCYFFSYNPNSRLCALKSFAASGTAVQDLSRSIVGPRKCDIEKSPSCVTEGVDYAGGTVTVLRGVSSAASCQSSCFLESRCALFSFYKTAEECHLKAHTARLSRRNSLDAVSGPKFCEASDCVLHGVNIPGNDIAVLQDFADTVQCQLECRKNSRCRFYSYNLHTSECYLKGEASRGTTSKGAAFLSGPRSCDESFAADISCIEFEVNFGGGTIAVVRKVTSEADCQSKCFGEARCVYFTLDVVNSLCYLKSEDASGTSHPQLGHASGPRVCPPPSATRISTPSMDRETTIPYEGACFWRHRQQQGRAIKAYTNIVYAAVCQRRCQAVPKCVVFEYQRSSRRCRLFAIDNSVDAPEDNGDRIGGPAVCPTKPPTTTEDTATTVPAICYEEDVNMPGFDESELFAASAASCQLKCRDHPRCFFFSFHANTRRCFLKGEAADDTSYSCKGITSGPKFCDDEEEEDEDDGAAEDGAAENGAAENGDAKVHEAKGDTDGLEVEGTTLDAKGDADAVEVEDTTLEAKGDVDGGPWAHPAERKSGEKTFCVWSGENAIDGHDVAVLDADHSTECLERCKKDPACFFFTFDRTGRRCFLKDEKVKADRASIRRGAEDFVSGSRDCSDDVGEEEKTVKNENVDFASTQNSDVLACLQEGIEFPSAYDVGFKRGVESAGDCMEVCRRLPQCAFFSYYKLDNACYLKRSDAKGQQRENEGYASGGRDCGMSLVTAPSTSTSVSCFDSGVYFPSMFDVGFKYLAESAEDCQAECKAHTECAFFSYHIASSACYLKGNGAELQRRTLAGYVSGPKECERNKRAESCIEEDVNYPSIFDVGFEGNVKSATDCLELCRAEPRCAFFSYYVPGQGCYLKRSEAKGKKEKESRYQSGSRSDCEV